GRPPALPAAVVVGRDGSSGRRATRRAGVQRLLGRAGDGADGVGRGRGKRAGSDATGGRRRDAGGDRGRLDVIRPGDGGDAAAVPAARMTGMTGTPRPGRPRVSLEPPAPAGYGPTRARTPLRIRAMWRTRITLRRAALAAGVLVAAVALPLFSNSTVAQDTKG